VWCFIVNEGESMIGADEKVQVLKDLASEVGMQKSNPIRERIPLKEREVVRFALGTIAERLAREYGLSVVEVRRLMHELVDVTV
jgi:transposase